MLKRPREQQIVPILAFGQYKGRLLTDAKIPLSYLENILQMTEDGAPKNTFTLLVSDELRDQLKHEKWRRISDQCKSKDIRTMFAKSCAKSCTKSCVGSCAALSHEEQSKEKKHSLLALAEVPSVIKEAPRVAPRVIHTSDIPTASDIPTETEIQEFNTRLHKINKTIVDMQKCPTCHAWIVPLVEASSLHTCS